MAYTVDGLGAYLLVFARVAGMVGANPIFARRNVPARARAALVLAMTVALFPAAGGGAGEGGPLLWGLLREGLAGIVLGWVFQAFYYMLFFAGDLMDMQFGLSMARVFDPGTNIQSSVSGNLLNVLFLLYFFATDSHLVLIRAAAASFALLPVGAAQFSGQAWGFLIGLFASAFSLALRLALPFVAAEFVMEVAMGVLMKLIPQIHIFVINIQFKVLLGILLLLAFSQPMADFVDAYMQYAFQGMQGALLALSG